MALPSAILTALLPLALAQPQPGSPWPMLGGSPQRGALSAASVAGAGAPALAWSRTFGAAAGGVQSSVAVAADGTLLFGAADRALHALNADGSDAWALPARGAVSSSPALAAAGAVGGGAVLVGAAYPDNRVLAADLDSGMLLWEYKTGSGVESSPLVGPDGAVYVGSDDGTLYAFGADGRGNLAWSFPTGAGNAILSSPAMTPDGARLFFGGSDGTLFALDAPTAGAGAALAWAFSAGAGAALLAAPSVSADGARVVVGSKAGAASALFSLNASTGALLWRAPLGADVTAGAALGADGAIFVATGYPANALLAFEAGGALRWNFPRAGGDRASAPALSADGAVVVGTLDGRVLAVEAATGALRWDYAAGAPVAASPAIGADGTIYVGTTGGALLALAPARAAPASRTVVYVAAALGAAALLAGVVFFARRRAAAAAAAAPASDEGARYAALG